MKHSLRSTITALCFLLLSSCAVGPIMVQETARSVPEGDHELSGGFGQAGYLLKWTYGLSDQLDLGVQLESLSVGFRVKYSFISNPEAGWSLASALGAGSSAFGTHRYVDLMGSYLNEAWEPFANLRIVHATSDEQDLTNEETGEVFFTFDETEVVYGQITLGSRYWPEPGFFVSFEATSIFFEGAATQIIPQIGLGWQL